MKASEGSNAVEWHWPRYWVRCGRYRRKEPSMEAGGRCFGGRPEPSRSEVPKASPRDELGSSRLLRSQKRACKTPKTRPGCRNLCRTTRRRTPWQTNRNQATTAPQGWPRSLPTRNCAQHPCRQPISRFGSGCCHQRVRLRRPEKAWKRGAASRFGHFARL